MRVGAQLSRRGWSSRTLGDRCWALEARIRAIFPFPVSADKVGIGKAKHRPNPSTEMPTFGGKFRGDILTRSPCSNSPGAIWAFSIKVERIGRSVVYEWFPWHTVAGCSSNCVAQDDRAQKNWNWGESRGDWTTGLVRLGVLSHMIG